ncbi:MAG: hypothetical protein WDM79_05880 [Terricaulis sp.]
MEAGIFVPIAFFGFLGAVILVPIWLKERTKQSAHHLISQALEKGQPLDPAIMTRLTAAAERQAPADRARRTLGSGVVLLALAGGFAGASYFAAGWDPSGFAGGGMMIPAFILGALGSAFILLAIVDYASKKKTDA